MVTSREEIEDSYEGRHKRSFVVLVCPHEPSGAFNGAHPAPSVRSANKANSFGMELKSTVRLQVANHVARVPKLLVLLAIPHSARKLA